MNTVLMVHFVLILSFLLLQIGFLTAGPIEIIYKSSSGGECECDNTPSIPGMPADECMASLLRQSSSGCGPTKIKVSPQRSSQVKYIFDYNVEIPVQTSKSHGHGTLKNLFAKVDKILIDTAPASPGKYVNTDCTCDNEKAVKAGLVAPCPVHQSGCAQRQHRYDKNSIKLLLKHSRNKRALHQGEKRHSLKEDKLEKFQARKLQKSNPKRRHCQNEPPRFHKKLWRARNHKARAGHRIAKREAIPAKIGYYNSDGSFEVPSSLVSGQYKMSGVLQYLPAALPSDVGVGQCYKCCAIKKNTKGGGSAYELSCEPISTDVSGKTSSARYYLSTTDSSYPTYMVGKSQQKGNKDRLVGIQLTDPNTGTTYQGSINYNTFQNYVKALIYSHRDFLKASGTNDGLVASAETQRETADEFMHKLTDAELEKLHEPRHEHMGFT